MTPCSLLGACLNTNHTTGVTSRNKADYVNSHHRHHNLNISLHTCITTSAISFTQWVQTCILQMPYLLRRTSYWYCFRVNLNQTPKSLSPAVRIPFAMWKNFFKSCLKEIEVSKHIGTLMTFSNIEIWSSSAAGRMQLTDVNKNQSRQHLVPYDS